MSTTPAPSPGPTSTHGADVGKRLRCARDDLYEQCSDHITAYMASSRSVGARPSSPSTAASSSSVMPSCWCIGSAIPAEISDDAVAEPRPNERRDAGTAPHLREDHPAISHK